MPTDPDAQRLLDLIAIAGRPRYQDLPVDEARLAMLAAREVLQPEPAVVAECRDIVIEGQGGPLALRFYRGLDAPAASSPCLVYYHGGGWVIGDLDTHDGVCRALASGAQCCVVSVDYRLAPEHPFPAAVEDAATSFQWVVAHADDLHVDPARVSVGGDSAGANLAAVVSLLSRDRSLAMPAAQVLIYPVTDLTATHPSYERVTVGVPLTAELMRWFRAHYLPEEADQVDWRASPLRAVHLKNLPPAFVLTVGLDPLCDEGIAYAQRLDRDCTQVTHLHLPSQIHGFLTAGRIIRAAGLALDTIASYLRLV